MSTLHHEALLETLFEEVCEEFPYFTEEVCKDYYNEVEEYDSISVYYNPLYWEVK